MTDVALHAITVPDAIREAFLALGGGVQRKSSILRWVNEKYPHFEERTLGTHLRGCSVNRPKANSRHPLFPRFLNWRGGDEYEVYEGSRDYISNANGYEECQVPDVSYAGEELREEIAEQIEERIGTEFAHEADLRDYLVKNLSLLESGLTLWTGDQQGSTEYVIEGRRIDILAKDRESNPVVVELKLSRGHERTLGQALYYRGKLKQILKVPRVRIIMVASEITDELKIASMEVSDVQLFSYALTMQVRQVDLSPTRS